MKRDHVYPIWIWAFWVLLAPVGLLGAGGAIVATTDEHGLPFDHADLWWLVVVVPLAGLVFLYGVYGRRRALDRFVCARLAPLLVAGMSPSWQAFGAGSRVIALLMLVAAILGPRWGVCLEQRNVPGIDMVVALDVSRSMLASDVGPNRLECAKREITRQLTQGAVFRRAHRVALLAFAGTTSLRLPLTTDRVSLESKLEALRVGSVPRGGTAIGRAIRRATDLFATSPEQASKIILLVTDGEDHEGQTVEVARGACRQHGIRILTIGVGDAALTAGAQVPLGDSRGARPLVHDGQIVFSKLDVDGLRRIAAAGGGRYAPIEDLHLLLDATADMPEVELTMEERVHHKPRYQWFLAVALLFVAIETIVGERRSLGDGAPGTAWRRGEF